nr:glycine-rich cell wall structural protein 2-like [Arachis hypogaea]
MGEAAQRCWQRGGGSGGAGNERGRGRREKGGEEGEGCGVWWWLAIWVVAAVLARLGVTGCRGEGGWEGKKRKRRREGRGWFGEGGAVAGARRGGAVAGWLVGGGCCRGEERVETVWEGGNVDAVGARFSRGLG